jgi:hypothetical protein
VSERTAAQDELSARRIDRTILLGVFLEFELSHAQQIRADLKSPSLGQPRELAAHFCNVFRVFARRFLQHYTPKTRAPDNILG